jgi:hypothetical protein
MYKERENAERERQSKQNPLPQQKSTVLHCLQGAVVKRRKEILRLPPASQNLTK